MELNGTKFHMGFTEDLLQWVAYRYGHNRIIDQCSNTMEEHYFYMYIRNYAHFESVFTNNNIGLFGKQRNKNCIFVILILQWKLYNSPHFFCFVSYLWIIYF